MNTLNRIKEVLHYYHISERALALEFGLNQPTLNRYLSGATEIKLELLERVAQRFPKVSCDWLLRGEGSMLKEQGDHERLQYLVKVIANQQATINNLIEQISILRK